MKYIKKIIEAGKYDRRKFAEALFPDAGFPLMALSRVEKGDGVLTAKQYQTLSELSNVPIGFLIAEKWSIDAVKPNELIFKKGEIEARLYTSSWVSVVSKTENGIAKILFDVKAENAPLSVFLEDIVNLIIFNNFQHLKSIKNE